MQFFHFINSGDKLHLDRRGWLYNIDHATSKVISAHTSNSGQEVISFRTYIHFFVKMHWAWQCEVTVVQFKLQWNLETICYVSGYWSHYSKLHAQHSSLATQPIHDCFLIPHDTEKTRDLRLLGQVRARELSFIYRKPFSGLCFYLLLSKGGEVPSTRIQMEQTYRVSVREDGINTAPLCDLGQNNRHIFT